MTLTWKIWVISICFLSLELLIFKKWAQCICPWDFFPMSFMKVETIFKSEFLTLEIFSFKFFSTWLNNMFPASFEMLVLWNWNCVNSWIFYLMHLKELFVWKVRMLKGEIIKVYKDNKHELIHQILYYYN